MDDSPGDCLEDYLALVKDRPELFANPPGDIYEILLDADGMRRAQADAGRLREARGMPSDDLRVGVLAHDPYLTVMREAVRFPDGTYGLYNRLLVTMGVAMLPVIDGKIVLMHRFRHGTRAWHLEIPRGCVDGGSARSLSLQGEGRGEGGARFEADARREIVEEIGAEGVALTHLGMLHSSTGCLDETYHLYLARITAIGVPEAHEAIAELRQLPVAEVESLIASGELTDGPTLACFLRARLRGLL